MKTAEALYPIWYSQGLNELEEHVDRIQRTYDALRKKDNIHGRSVKAILDLRIELLETWKAAPSQLEPVRAAASIGKEAGKGSEA